MVGQIWTQGGKEWEEQILLLLKRKYSPKGFIEIPDKDQGDYGLEGFSKDGSAYQCYAAEEPLSNNDLYNNQRNKISRDIRKFIKNKDGLEQIFGLTKISCWVLVVPRWESKRLLEHAEKKANEVRAANLPYVAKDFFINIITEDYFTVEKQNLLNAGVKQIRIEPDDFKKECCNQHIKDEQMTINLDGKIKQLSPKKTLSDLNEERNQFLYRYVTGQNILYKLHSDYPDIFMKVRRIKKDHEEFLEIESITQNGTPADIFNNTMDKFHNKMTDELIGIHSYTIKILVFEAMSDWLLRCPLKFPRYEDQ